MDADGRVYIHARLLKVRIVLRCRVQPELFPRCSPPPRSVWEPLTRLNGSSRRSAPSERTSSSWGRFPLSEPGPSIGRRQVATTHDETSTQSGSCRCRVTMIGRLVDAGLPAAFVLATDAALALGARLCRAVSTFMDEPYVLVEDAWAWQIPRGSAGWPPHRGMSALLERPRPELLNTWVALSDASIDRSCMHFVRLDEDPNYPDTLASIDLGSPLTTRPAPLTAGEALVWNANILHWGGSCSLEAAGARVSCSFSLVRADALSAMGVRPLSTDLTPLERIDFVAGQIATYGDGQRDVSNERLQWAKATVALREHILFPRP